MTDVVYREDEMREEGYLAEMTEYREDKPRQTPEERVKEAKQRLAVIIGEPRTIDERIAWQECRIEELKSKYGETSVVWYAEGVLMGLKLATVFPERVEKGGE